MNKQNILFAGSYGKTSTQGIFDRMKSEMILVHKYKKPRNAKKKFKIINRNSSNLLRGSLPIPASSKVIRWGATTVLPGIEKKGIIVYNKSRAIALASNKRKAREALLEGGASVPKNVTPKNYEYEDLPIIGRPHKHHKGKFIEIFRNKTSFEKHYARNTGWYYSKFIAKDREFRVHAAHGKILSIMEKFPPNGNKKAVAWNRALDDSEPFAYVGHLTYNRPDVKNVCYQALLALEILGLDFGGVDVITKGDTAYLLEVNTAPTIPCSDGQDYTSIRYANYFDWLLSVDHRRKPWNYKEYTKGISYSWKDSHFTREYEPEKETVTI